VLPNLDLSKNLLGLFFGSPHLSDSDFFPSSYCGLASIFRPQARLAKKKQITLKERMYPWNPMPPDHIRMQPVPDNRTWHSVSSGFFSHGN
jgi:hypothetical protein